jgi:hypothetical protein
MSPVELVSTVLPPDVKQRNVNLTIHFHLLLKLRMSGAVPLFSPYTFVAWTGAAISFLHLYEMLSFYYILLR